MKLKINSRKYDCPECGVKSGSRHNKSCPYAYKLLADSKMLKTKIKIGVLHRLAHMFGFWNGYCDSFYKNNHLYMSFVCVNCGKRYGTHCIDGLIEKAETEISKRTNNHD